MGMSSEERCELTINGVRRHLLCGLYNCKGFFTNNKIIV